MLRFVLFGIALLLSNSAFAAFTVTCPPARWPGASVTHKDQRFEQGDDGIQLKEMKYRFEDGSFRVTYNDEELNASLLNSYQGLEQGYVVVVYKVGGVANVDTIFTTGIVYSYVTKLSLNLFPLSSIFYKQCNVEWD